MTNRAVLERRRQNAELQRQAVLAAMSQQEIERRIHSLVASGVSEHDVAAVLKLDVQFVRRALAPRSQS